jgi:hypothetical protein
MSSAQVLAVADAQLHLGVNAAARFRRCLEQSVDQFLDRHRLSCVPFVTFIARCTSVTSQPVARAVSTASSSGSSIGGYRGRGDPHLGAVIVRAAVAGQSAPGPRRQVAHRAAAARGPRSGARRWRAPGPPHLRDGRGRLRRRPACRRHCHAAALSCVRAPDTQSRVLPQVASESPGHGWAPKAQSGRLKILHSALKDGGVRCDQVDIWELVDISPPMN